MKYDIEELSRNLGFEARNLEKVLRITDVLEDISNVKFLKNRLSLYGGTALNFLHFRDTPRLSVDLDFNYRHLDDNDWAEIRDEVDNRIKEVLYLEDYGRDDVRINPSYPLVRFDVSYQSSLAGGDSFILEVGYMRRFSVLEEDDTMEFPHLGGGRNFEVRTPKREEIFANKIATCIYRTTARDAYDVYRIAGEDFEREALRKCLVIESLMEGKNPIHELDISERLKSVSMDFGLENLIREEMRVSFKEVVQGASAFIDKITSGLTEDEKNLIKEFYTEKRFEPSRIDVRGIFHEDISKHPAIRWTLENL